MQREEGGASCSEARGTIPFCRRWSHQVRRARIGSSCGRSQSLLPAGKFFQSLFNLFYSSHLLDFMVGSGGGAKCETRILAWNPLSRLGGRRLGTSTGLRLGCVSVGGGRLEISAARNATLKLCYSFLSLRKYFQPTKILGNLETCAL